MELDTEKLLKRFSNLILEKIRKNGIEISPELIKAYVALVAEPTAPEQLVGFAGRLEAIEKTVQHLIEEMDSLSIFLKQNGFTWSHN